jgi:hypothetical protein
MTADDLHYVPLVIQHQPWTDDNVYLLERRAHWFSDQVDPADASAQHYLALRKGEPVGYLRVDESGELNVIGVYGNQLETHQTLLRFAMMDAPLRGLSRLWAPNLAPWQTLLPDLGFEAGSPGSTRLEYFLPPHRVRQASGSELVRLSTPDELRSFSLTLARHAQRALYIYSDDLEPAIYDNDNFGEAVLALVRRNSKFTKVHILVRDTRVLQERGHRLLNLYHQTDHQVMIRKLTLTGSVRQPAYVIADDKGLLFRPDGNIPHGIGYLDYRARVKTLLDEFGQMWNVAREDPNLRHMMM